MGTVCNYGSSDPDLTKAENDYIGYIDGHMYNVRHAYRDLFFDRVGEIVFPGYNEDETSDIILRKLSYAISTHDSTKYSDDEFNAYRKQWYPTAREKACTDNDIINQNIAEYEEAWRHHYTNNDHHPQFYKYCKILQRDEYGTPTLWEPLERPLEIAQDMSIVSVCHMICDWEAMSRAKNGNTINWYCELAFKERAAMSDNTRKMVEEMLKLVYKVDTLPEIAEKDPESTEEQVKSIDKK